MATFTVFKKAGGRWYIRNEYGVIGEWGPFLTRRGALRRARKLKKNAETPSVRV